MFVSEKIGNEVKNARIIKKLKQGELANMVYTSKSKISSYEKGEISDLELLERVYNALDLDFTYIKNIEDIMRQSIIADPNVPDVDLALDIMIQVRLEANQRETAKSKKRSKIATAIIIALVAYSVLNITNDVVYAITKKHIWEFVGFGNSTVKYDLYPEGENPVRITPGGYQDAELEDSVKIDKESLAELNEAFYGNVYLPTVLPDECAFNGLNTMSIDSNYSEDIPRPQNNEFNGAVITYSSPDADLIFELSEIEEGTDGYLLIDDTGIRTEQTVTFDNASHKLLLIESDGSKTAYLVVNYVLYKISYNISNEQLIKVIESFAYLNPIESLIDGNNVDNNSDVLQIEITEEEPIQIGTKVHETATNIDSLASTFSKDVFVIDHLPEGLELKESRYRTDIINFASITYATDTYDKKINLEMVEIAKDSGVYANIGIGENAFTSEQEIKIAESSIILNHSWSDGDGFNFIVFVHDEIMYKFSYTIDTDEMIKVIENMTYISRE